YRLFHDRGFVAAHTPALDSYLERLGGELDDNERDLLQRERYSADVGESVFGLHSQAVVRQGLLEMGAVWGGTGRPDLAARARSPGRAGGGAGGGRGRGGGAAGRGAGRAGGAGAGGGAGGRPRARGGAPAGARQHVLPPAGRAGPQAGPDSACRGGRERPIEG